MRISDWSSDVCSTDLQAQEDAPQRALAAAAFADQAERLAAPDGQVDAVGRLHQDARIAGHAAPEAAPRVVVLDQRPGFDERRDRKSTRLNSSTNAHLVCRLLLEKKKNRYTHQH